MKSVFLMRLTLPDFALVLLIGVSGSGKSTFARRHFAATEIVSSDACRGMVADDENDQCATPDAFALVHALLDLRLKRRRFCVVDATNLYSEDRLSLRLLGKRHYAPVVAIVLDPGSDVCIARDARRRERTVGADVITAQHQALVQTLRSLPGEGFRAIHVLGSEQEIADVTFGRLRLASDQRQRSGPFDIIGDVHGCADELEDMLERLGYAIAVEAAADGETRYRVRPPEGRTAVFLGDIVDRGPRIADTLRLVMDMVADGSALCVLGNHEAKLKRWLEGKNVSVTHGLACSAAELERTSPKFRTQVAAFIGELSCHYVLDGGRLAVTHAGIREEMLNRLSRGVHSFCVYGETDGSVDLDGKPLRRDWAATYRGATKIIYGHTPLDRSEWINNTLCLDTGCVFGGKLSALRYPELEIISMPARRNWSAAGMRS